MDQKQGAVAALWGIAGWHIYIVGVIAAYQRLPLGFDTVDPVVSGLAGVAFLRWFVGVHRRVHGAETPMIGIVVAWLIPIANVVYPLLWATRLRRAGIVPDRASHTTRELELVAFQWWVGWALLNGLALAHVAARFVGYPAIDGPLPWMALIYSCSTVVAILAVRAVCVVARWSHTVSASARTGSSDPNRRPYM